MKNALLFIVALLGAPPFSFAQNPSGSDIATVRDRYIASVLPATQEARENAKTLAAKFAVSLKTDGSWDDVDYTGTDRAVWTTCDHLERAAVMARAARMKKDSGQVDEALVAKTLLALHYWNEKDYRNSNWWWNEIHVPQLMGEIGNLLRAEIPAADVAKMIEIMERSDWEHGPKHTWSGANLSDSVAIEIARGLIEDNADTIAQAFDRGYQEIRVVTPPEQGIQPDDSFHQHGNQLYNGGYGLGFAIVSVRLALLGRGTRFQMPADRMKILVDYLVDGEQWIMYNRQIDYSVSGRGITRETRVLPTNRGSVEARWGLGGLMAALAVDPIPRQKELLAFAGRLNQAPDAQPLVGNRQFWYSDFMVHRRASYDTSVKMLSNRMQNAELVNLEGKKSVHLSDGTNYLYLKGDEYTNVFVGWDWTHVPGTTAIQGTLDTGERNPIAVTGTTTFDGGVTDGVYGMTAMDLARGKLTARKAWFFFDTSYVALGTGITLADDTEHEVATSVNQPLLIGDVLSSQMRGPVPPGTRNLSSRSPVWIYHNHVGYVFPHPTELTLSTGPRTGNWNDIGVGPKEPATVQVFDLWINHGLAPKDAGYEYIVLPGTTPKQVAVFAKASDIAVLSNTAGVQAAYNKTVKLAEIALRQAGTVATPIGPVEADHSCLLLVRQAGGGFKVTASNPENQPLTLHVKVKGKQAEMLLPGGELAGSSVTVEVK